MSHRCSVCDWSPYTDSHFFNSLSHKPSRLVISDNTVYCNVCLEEVEALVQEDTDEEFVLEYEYFSDDEVKEQSDSGEESSSLP